MHFEATSFRDPFGRIFGAGDTVRRAIFAAGAEDYLAARDAGLFPELIDGGRLQPHREIAVPANAPPGTRICLEHPRLPFISYPWEWPFSLLKDAALLQLDLMEALLPRGFWLRDASAFNVQFDGQRFRHIDTLSIGRRPPGAPWGAYGQFCSHFLAPLAVASRVDARLLGLWRDRIDGFPLDLAVGMLPALSRWRPRLLVHLTLHASLQRAARRRENLGRTEARRVPQVGERALTGLVRSLRYSVMSLRPPAGEKLWLEYAGLRTYSASDVDRKARFVRDRVVSAAPRLVLDLGSNTGEFSRLAARSGALVVAIDSDAACADDLYRNRNEAGGTLPILPLTMDLANPTPALGWGGRERASLGQRGPADLVLALAVLHHLVLSSNVPLPLVVDWLRELAPRAILEFVPPEDPMVLKLVEHRRGEHLPYDYPALLAALAPRFEVAASETLDNGRVLLDLRSSR